MKREKESIWIMKINYHKNMKVEYLKKEQKIDYFNCLISFQYLINKTAKHRKLV